MENKLFDYILMLGDQSMILAHRLSELCGHGPTLETDIALTNISLDLFGQVRNYFRYAASIDEGDSTEDSIAFLRKERQYKSAILLEQPNTDFAFVIGRQFLFDVFHQLLLKDLINSKDEQIAAIATKSIKEVNYHVRLSSQWIRRLGLGTEVSHQKMQNAIDTLLPFAHELYTETELEKEMKEQGIGADLNAIKDNYIAAVHEVLAESNIVFENTSNRVAKGKQGMHTEHMGYIIAELQYMQRAYPNMQW